MKRILDFIFAGIYSPHERGAVATTPKETLWRVRPYYPTANAWAIDASVDGGVTWHEAMKASTYLREEGEMQPLLFHESEQEAIDFARELKIIGVDEWNRRQSAIIAEARDKTERKNAILRDRKPTLI